MNRFAVQVSMVALMIMVMINDVRGGTAYYINFTNQVNPCAGGSYSTISIFVGYSQQVLAKGQSYQLTVTTPQYTGAGIQENGEYCRYFFNKTDSSDSSCVNPDNAGMQLWINNQNCQSISLDDPFYCGQYPPNAKKIVGVTMGGTFPYCTATLYRLSTAPNCQYSCPAGVNNNTGAGSTSTGSGSGSASASASSTSASSTTSSVRYPIYKGCYIDGQTGRDLGLNVATNMANSMTVEVCTAACKSAGKAYAGLQYARECWCGNAYGNQGGIVADSQCNMKCNGNSSEFCGAGNRNSIYQVQSLSTADNLLSDELPNTAANMMTSGLMVTVASVLFAAVMLF